MTKKYGAAIGLGAILLFVASLVFAEVTDPNQGGITSYPSDQKPDKPGTGASVSFDMGKGKAKQVLDPGAESSDAYPKKAKPDKRGSGEYEDFTQGPVQYPGRYRNPMDDAKPPVIADEEDETPPDLPDLPENVCPLTRARADFQKVNHYTRLETVTNVDTEQTRVVVYTRQRRLTPPLAVEGGITLRRTLYDPASRSWTADVYLPPGYSCESGVWRVRVDDSLTDDVAVLAIGPRVVLLSVGDELAYLRLPGSKPVEFRMVWDTGIEVEFEQQVEKQPVKGSKKTTRKKNRPRKARRTKRR